MGRHGHFGSGGILSGNRVDDCVVHVMHSRAFLTALSHRPTDRGGLPDHETEALNEQCIQGVLCGASDGDVKGNVLFGRRLAAIAVLAHGCGRLPNGRKFGFASAKRREPGRPDFQCAAQIKRLLDADLHRDHRVVHEHGEHVTLELANASPLAGRKLQDAKCFESLEGFAYDATPHTQLLGELSFAGKAIVGDESRFMNKIDHRVRDTGSQGRGDVIREVCVHIGSFSSDLKETIVALDEVSLHDENAKPIVQVFNRYRTDYGKLLTWNMNSSGSAPCPSLVDAEKALCGPRRNRRCTGQT
ncbi:hypothetical protein X997_4072 [Burkholderia pseudomallei A79C]|nr:hypothetical protein X997_4072 [Burkholderia pseudomallei A79C]